MKIALAFVLVWAVFITVSAAQSVKPIDIVDIRPSAHVKASKNGHEITLTVKLAVKKGWHINAHQPLDKYLIPTELILDSTKGYTAGTITYPPAEIVKLAMSDDDLALYLSEATMTVVVIVPASYKDKSITVSGVVRYQPCNDQTCLFPVKKPFSLSVALRR